VDANGGTPAPVTKLAKGEEAHHWPWFLPDGEHFLFLGDAPKTEDHHLRLGSLKDGSSTILTQAVSNVTYIEPSTILFVRGGALMAQKLDVGRKTLTGEPRVLAENLRANSQTGHHFEFSASLGGRLVYRAASSETQLTWVDRTGRQIETVSVPRRYDSMRISPDQRRIAFGDYDADGRSGDLWLLDPARDMTTRFTFDAASDLVPVWSPDGTKIAFASMRQGFGNTFIADVANPAGAQPLTNFPTETGMPSDWSPDGRTILINVGKSRDSDIWAYSLPEKKLTPYVSTQFQEYDAVFSRDGKFIAYTSEESGQPEVYVERFPTHAERRQVSVGGGYGPRWRADGRELFYMTAEHVHAVDMTREDATPQVLFRETANVYEPAADGQRFLMTRPLHDITTIPLTFVSRWDR
jgi:eukaryotic-like serine/threonine-protein kinase